VFSVHIKTCQLVESIGLGALCLLAAGFDISGQWWSVYVTFDKPV